MKVKRAFPLFAHLLPLFALGFTLTALVLAQSPQDIAARLGYPQMILHNAKILTVDDASFTSNLGTIAQAMAIRNQKILALGDNSEIRALAGPQTQLVDLRGRTVVPGFVLVHSHPWDYVVANKEIMQEVVPEEIAVQRFLSGPPREQIMQFPQVFEEAVQAARPGAWIKIVFLWDMDISPEDPWIRFAGTRITKEQLDRGAPNNPVEVRARQTVLGQPAEGMLNQRAIELIRKEGLPDALRDVENLVREERAGVVADLQVQRMILPQVMLKDQFDHYMEIQRLQLSWWAGKGQTTVGGFLYHQPHLIRAYRLLDRSGQLPHRVAWGWGRIYTAAWERDFQDPFLIADLATREGTGTDYMWYFGTGDTGGGCVSSAPIVADAKVMPGGADCTVRMGPVSYQASRPDGPVWDALYQIVKFGGRLISSHQFGDVTIDNVLDLIESASEDGGLSKGEIRARRHTADHMQGWPRPDQIPRIKDLGMVVGGTNLYIYQDSPRWLRDYGEQALDWVVPRRSMVEAGVMNAMELDKPYLGEVTVFTALSWAVVRKAMDGKVYAPHQRISREIALKTGTIWGGYYVLKEDVLGSLEPGKFADFLVLDKDYLTIPEEEIAKLRILMTAVGGKVKHLVPSLAGELGMEPVGAQVELGGPAASY